MDSRGQRVVVACSGTPLPVTSGGRKRATRLFETMQRAGALPHLLVGHRLLPEDREIAMREAAERGWELEDLPYPPGNRASRVRQHARQEMNRHSPQFARRLSELGAKSPFIQFEEIGAMQYLGAAPGGVPTIVSAYNVDSEVEAASAVEARTPAERLQIAYHARRMRATERRAAKRAGLIVCVSDHDDLYFRRRGATRTLVTPNGVDEELFALPAQPAVGHRVLFFGSYVWPSNLAGLTRFVREAWPAVRARVPRAELRVAGPGPLEAIREAAASTDGVRLLGFVDDLLEELRTASVVIVPIWFGGGTRIKVLEALAAARPVVGTSVGVERIGFVPGRHGLVADDPAGLAEATVRVLGDAALAARLARDGRELAEGFRWQAATAALEQVYRGYLE